MKCKKCGVINQEGSDYCSNCGNKLDIPNSKNNSKIIIIIVIIVLIGGCGGYFLIKSLTGFKDPFPSIDDLAIKDNNIIIPTKIGNSDNIFMDKLYKDYEKGTLNADEYIMQFAYAIYENDKLDNKYKNSKMDFSNIAELYKKAEKLQDELSDDTIIYLYQKYTLGNITLGDSEDNQGISIKNNLESYKVDKLVNADNNVSKLDKVKLSSDGHFLIYYSIEGANATTDANVNKIAEHLEYSVSEYKNKYGYEFKYNVQRTGNSGALFQSAYTRASNLLKENNIDDKYLEIAMPVFIVNLEGTNALGFYCPPLAWLEQRMVNIYNLFADYGKVVDIMTTTYGDPFFVVNSKSTDFDNMKLIASHELFHHYQNYICGNGEYTACPSGDFTIETTANLMTINVANVNKVDTALVDHAYSYIMDVESSLDKVGSKFGAIGYGAYIFGYNYSEIVPNGIKTMFNSVSYENPLKYIYDNSEGKYKEVFNTLAIKNLTLDYDNKVLIAATEDEVYYPNNHADITPNNHKMSENINYSSIHYYYINPNNYSKDAQLTFNSTNEDLTLQLFVYDENKYQHLYTYTLDKDFTINIDDFNYYYEVVIAIVNSEIEGSLNYTYEIDNSGDKEPTITAEDLNLKNNRSKIENSTIFNCHTIEDDEEFKIITQVRIEFDKKDKINDLFIKSTAQIKNYDPKNPAFKFAKNLVTTVINGIQLVYEEKFKDYKIITNDEDDRYSITLKINKDFYDVLNDGFSVQYEDKYDVIKEFESDGYYCTYE